MTRGKVVAVVGGQFGSEGKGVIVNHLADQFQVHVRVGGPNAGHSFYRKAPVYNGGEITRYIHVKEVMQQLPCGWTNRDAVLVIGPGAVVDLWQLEQEIDHVENTFDPDIRKRVMVSAHAFPLVAAHHDQEGGVEGDLHKKIGSTGHGVGAARLERMERDPGLYGVRPVGEHLPPQSERPITDYYIHPDIPRYFQERLGKGDNILLEGTQGSGLSLVHGPWPYVTSADTNVAQLLADAGIPPRLLDRTIMVCRTYPIRVAGNSGPMHNEISWDKLNQRLNKSGVTEQTTVTKKTRRIGEWDEELVLRAVCLNGPTDLAITFLDYLDPDDEGKENFSDLGHTSHSFVEYVETLTGVPVTLLGTGGPHWSVVENNFKL